MLFFTVGSMGIMFFTYDSTTSTAVKATDYATSGIAKFYLSTVSLGGYSSSANLFYEVYLENSFVFELSCQSGTLSSSSNHMYFGMIPHRDIGKNIYHKTTLNQNCNDNSVFDTAFAACWGTTSCKVTFSNTFFSSDCRDTMATTNKAYFHFYCHAQESEFVSNCRKKPKF